MPVFVDASIARDMLQKQILYWTAIVTRSALKGTTQSKKIHSLVTSSEETRLSSLAKLVALTNPASFIVPLDTKSIETNWCVNELTNNKQINWLVSAVVLVFSCGH